MLNNPPSGAAQTLGDMPLGKQWGYLFGGTVDARTLAHELGHGMFDLRHTFADDACGSTKQGKTGNNLMDYPDPNSSPLGGGQEGAYDTLVCQQWNYMHNTAIVGKVFQDDADGASLDFPVVQCISSENSSKFTNLTFLDPNHNSINIQGGVPLGFFSESDDTETLHGTLWGFTIGEKKYIVHYNSKTKMFVGYANPAERIAKNVTSLVGFEEIAYKYPTEVTEPQYVKVTDGCNFSVLEKGKLTFSFTQDDCSCYENKDAEPEIVDIICRDLTETEFDELVTERSEVLSGKATTPSIGNKYMIVDSQFSLDEEDVDLVKYFEDNFGVFADETSGQEIYVDIYPVDGKPSEDQLSKLSNQIVQKAGLSKNKIIYVSIPTWNTTEITSSLHKIEKTVYDISIYAYESGLQTTLNQISLESNVFKNIQNIYSQIPKPYILCQYFIDYRGDIIETRLSEKQNQTGKSLIYDYRLTVDQRVSSYISLLKTIEANKPYITATGIRVGNEYTIMAYYNALQEIRNFKTKYPIPNNVIVKHGLLQSALQGRSGDNSEYSNAAQQFALWYRNEHLFGSVKYNGLTPETVSIADSWFLIGENQVEKDDFERQLQVIDALGLALAVVDLDIITDLLGTIYAGCYGEWGIANEYFAGVFIPVVSGGILKMSDELTDEVKLLAQGDLTLRYKDKYVEFVTPGNNVLNETIANKLSQYTSNNTQLVKLHDEILAAGFDISKIDDALGNLLVKAGNGSTTVLAQIAGFGDALTIFKNDLLVNNSALLNAIANKPDLVKAWGYAQNAPATIRQKGTLLDLVLTISAKKLNEKALDVKKLFDNGFGTILEALDESGQVARLERLNEWDAKLIDQLASRLGRTTDYPNLVADLTVSEIFDLYDNVIHTSADEAYNLVKEVSNTNLDRVVKSKFFTEYCELGNKLEEKVLEMIKDNGSGIWNKLGLNPDDYVVFSQVRLKVGDPDLYMVADQVLVRKKFNTDMGAFVLLPDDVYIIENKLSSTTDYTARQKQGWAKVNRGEMLEVMSVNKYDVNNEFRITKDADSFTVGKQNVKRVDSPTTDIESIQADNVNVNTVIVSNF